jgi:hypothetical protein
MGQSDTPTNSGTIHGSVTLGIDDSFYSESGAIAGAITAAATDYFDFTGSIGHVTIADFVTAAHAHDVIHFGNDDFAIYAALQVGKDVAIRLDQADTIVLDNTTLAHLSTHDFTFV